MFATDPHDTRRLVAESHDIGWNTVMGCPVSFQHDTYGQFRRLAVMVDLGGKATAAHFRSELGVIVRVTAP